MKIALVHDDFVQQGGAERLFATLAKIFPKADIYTSLVDYKTLPKEIDKSRIKTSFMQKIPFAIKLYKSLLFLFPLAFESFDFKGYDLVISSTTRFANSIITNPKTVHISYVNSLPRFLYKEKEVANYVPSIIYFFVRPLFVWLQKWDIVASSRADYYIANSKNVAGDIKKFYKRESTIIHPCADTDFFTPGNQITRKPGNQSYYLVVSRLVRWKKIDAVIEAFTESKKKLVIVGNGPDKPRLESLANGLGIDFHFADYVSNEELRSLYRKALALIVPQEEDFGINMVEANACGLPIIAYARGGQKEIVVDGKTGLFFSGHSKESIQDAMKRASQVKWSVSECRENALRFTKGKFTKDIKAFIEKHGQTRRP